MCGVVHAVPPQPNGITDQLGRVAALGQRYQSLVGRHVIDAVGNNLAVGGDGKVVIERVHLSIGSCCTGPVDIAQQLLLLGVNADDRQIPHGVMLAELRDPFELGIAIRRVADGQILAGLPAAQFKLFAKQPIHRVGTGIDAVLRQRIGQLAGGPIGPEFTIVCSIDAS